MRSLPVHVWLQTIIVLPINGFKSSHIALNRYPRLGLVSWFWLNLDHYLSLGRGAPWLRGLPRIPQRGALLLHANSFYPSIHPSISRPFFCVVLLPSPSVCPFSCFYPCQEDYIVLLSRFPPPIPLLSLCLPSQFKTSSHWAAISPNPESQSIT